MITKDSHHEVSCWSCHCTYLLPRALYVAARASEKISFYCPYGHIGHYPAGETVEDQLRRERDRLKQQLAQRDDEISRVQASADKANREWGRIKAVQMRMQKRISAGVCPCCHRSFKQLANHMKFKHPEFRAEAA